MAPKVGLDAAYGAWLRGALKPLFFDHLAIVSGAATLTRCWI